MEQGESIIKDNLISKVPEFEGRKHFDINEVISEEDYNYLSEFFRTTFYKSSILGYSKETCLLLLEKCKEKIKFKYKFLLIEYFLYETLSPAMKEDSFTLNLFIFDDQQKMRKLKYNPKYFLEGILEFNANSGGFLNEKFREFLEGWKKIICEVPEILEVECAETKKKLYSRDFFKNEPLLEILRYIFNEKKKLFIENHQVDKFLHPRSDNQKKYEEFIKYSQRLEEEPGLYFEDFIVLLFITYKIRNSKEKNLKNIKFCYDLTLGCIKNIHSMTTLPPILFEEKITEVNLTKNGFSELGLFQMGLILYLSPNVLSLTLEENKIDSYQLNAFVSGCFGYRNSSLKFLDLSNNLLDHNCNKSLVKLLIAFPSLEALILANNEIGSACGAMFYTLKNLYRQPNGSSLKELYLEKVKMDPNSIHELSQLVESPQCKLELIDVSFSNFNNWAGLEFFKKMKSNYSILKLIMHDTNINKNHFKGIKSMLIQNSLNYLYIYRNSLNSFKYFIELISTTIVSISKENRKRKFLCNLDIGGNTPFCLNEQCVEHLIEKIKLSDLSMLDLQWIFYKEGTDKGKKAKIVSTAIVEKFKNEVFKFSDDITCVFA